MDAITGDTQRLQLRNNKQAVPEFRCELGFVDGARETMLDMKKRGVWRRHREDAEYSALVQRALDLGFEKLTA